MNLIPCINKAYVCMYVLYVRIYVPSTLAHETRWHENKNWPVGVVFLPAILEVEIPSDLQQKTHRTLGDLARWVSGQSVVLITPSREFEPHMNQGFFHLLILRSVVFNFLSLPVSLVG